MKRIFAALIVLVCIATSLYVPMPAMAETVQTSSKEAGAEAANEIEKEGTETVAPTEGAGTGTATQAEETIIETETATETETETATETETSDDLEPVIIDGTQEETISVVDFQLGVTPVVLPDDWSDKAVVKLYCNGEEVTSHTKVSLEDTLQLSYSIDLTKVISQPVTGENINNMGPYKVGHISETIDTGTLFQTPLSIDKGSIHLGTISMDAERNLFFTFTNDIEQQVGENQITDINFHGDLKISEGEVGDQESVVINFTGKNDSDIVILVKENQPAPPTIEKSVASYDEVNHKLYLSDKAYRCREEYLGQECNEKL